MPEILLRLPQIIGSERATPKRITPVPSDSSGPPKPKKIRVTERPQYPAIIPISKSAWWEGVKEGKYPKPIKLGSRTTVWRASEVYALAVAQA